MSLDLNARSKRLGNGVDASKSIRPNKKDKSQRNFPNSYSSETVVDNQKTSSRDKETNNIKLSHQRVKRPNNYQWNNDKKSQEGGRGGGAGHVGGRQRDGGRPEFDQKGGFRTTQGGAMSYRDRTGGRRVAPTMNRYNAGSSYSDCGGDDVKARNDISGGQNNPHQRDLNRNRDCSMDEEGGRRRPKSDTANFQNRYGYPRRHYPQAGLKRNDDNIIRNGVPIRRTEENAPEKTEIESEEVNQAKEGISTTPQDDVANHHSIGRCKVTRDTHRPGGQQAGGMRPGPGLHPTRRPNFRKQNNQATHGRWNGRSAGTSESDAVGTKNRDEESKQELGGKSSEDPPVSHLMVLTGPPTKAFTNTVGNGHSPAKLHDNDVAGSSKSTLGPPPGFDLADASVFGNVSLPPGFKPRSQIPMAPPGFKAVD